MTCGLKAPGHYMNQCWLLISEILGSHRSFKVFSKTAPFLFDWFASYVAQIQPVGGQCVVHHFQVKRSKVKVTFKVFAVSAPWLCAYLTDSFHMWHKTWSGNVSCIISRSKGQWSRSYGSFKVFAISAYGFMPIWLMHFIWDTYTAYEGFLCNTPFPGQKVKVTQVIHI